MERMMYLMPKILYWQVVILLSAVIVFYLSRAELLFALMFGAVLAHFVREPKCQPNWHGVGPPLGKLIPIRVRDDDSSFYRHGL